MANALITGASSGIGLSTARRMALRGHQVLLLSYDEVELQQACASIGPRAVPVLCDLSHRDQVDGLWARLEELHGPIDYLINNAGIGFQGPVVDTETAVFRRIMEVNFFAAVSLCQQAVAAMKIRRRGHILNLTSASARRSLAGIGAYGASKAALHALTQSLRMEASLDGIRVSEVLPISVRTAFFERANYQPRGLTQSPEHVAEAILYCLDRNIPEYTTHWPTGMGFGLDALMPNWIARLMNWWHRRHP